jgi:hypothetical protein
MGFIVSIGFDRKDAGSFKSTLPGHLPPSDLAVAVNGVLMTTATAQFLMGWCPVTGSGSVRDNNPSVGIHSTGCRNLFQTDPSPISRGETLPSNLGQSVPKSDVINHEVTKDTKKTWIKYLTAKIR